MEKARFESLGVYLPEKIVSTRELISQMKITPVFDLEDLTGIRYRRWRSESEDSFALAVKAARLCLEKSRYAPEDLDAIICCSITRFKDGLTYWLEPSISGFVKKELGCRPSAINFDLTNACAGMFTGVYILNNMIKAGVVKNGMVFSGECITPIAETAAREIKDPIDDQFAALTVGDSGAAVIIDRSPDGIEGIDIAEFMSIAQFAKLCLAMPSTETAGVAMYTRAVDLHKEMIDRLPHIFKYLSRKHDVTGRDFDFVIPHQTSIRAIRSGMKLCQESFEVIPEILFSVNDYGNTSSTSHFVVLYDHLKKGIIKDNARILFLPQASGIMVGVFGITIGKLEVDYGSHH